MSRINAISLIAYSAGLAVAPPQFPPAVPLLAAVLAPRGFRILGVVVLLVIVAMVVSSWRTQAGAKTDAFLERTSQVRGRTA